MVHCLAPLRLCSGVNSPESSRARSALPKTFHSAADGRPKRTPVAGMSVMLGKEPHMQRTEGPLPAWHSEYRTPQMRQLLAKMATACQCHILNGVCGLRPFAQHLRRWNSQAVA